MPVSGARMVSLKAVAFDFIWHRHCRVLSCRRGGLLRHPVLPVVQDGQPDGRGARTVYGDRDQGSGEDRRQGASPAQIVRRVE